MSACDYLVLRAKFTMPPRKKSLSTLRNLRIESQKSATNCPLFHGVLPRNSHPFLEIYVCKNINTKRRFLGMPFLVYRDCMTQETLLNSETSCR